MRDPEKWCLEYAEYAERLRAEAAENLPRCTGHPREYLDKLDFVFDDFAAGLREVAASLPVPEETPITATNPPEPCPDQPEAEV